MGKNKFREYLIRGIANIAVHEIIAKHTNKPESEHFINSEIIEYRNQTEKIATEFNWNIKDKELVEERALKLIREKLTNKYQDINYSEQEAIKILNEIVNDIM